VRAWEVSHARPWNFPRSAAQLQCSGHRGHRGHYGACNCRGPIANCTAPCGESG
jgi:hypothetical protein